MGLIKREKESEFSSSVVQTGRSNSHPFKVIENYTPLRLLSQLYIVCVRQCRLLMRRFLNL